MELFPGTAQLVVVTEKVRTESWLEIKRILEFGELFVNPVFHGYPDSLS